MSHTTTLKGLQIRDVAAMQSAVAELQSQGVKCTLVQSVVPRMYYNNQHKACAYVLRLDDAKYDVGFDLQSDGTYSPVFDEWANIVGGKIGATCPMPRTAEGRAQHQIGRFLQSYAKHATMNAAAAQGYMVESATTDEEGNVHLVLAGM